ncbi:MAG: hypothetical protein ACYDHD_08190 [Vulcanimicrobiaceae bacterium]
MSVGVSARALRRDVSGQRGTSLVEVIVALGLVAVVGGALLYAVGALAHLSPDPARTALTAYGRRELAIAAALEKYAGNRVQPRSVQTSIPLPAGTPMPIAASLSVTLQADGTRTLTVTAWPQGNTSQRVRRTLVVPAPAPIPGSSVLLPVTSAPTGAP